MPKEKTPEQVYDELSKEGAYEEAHKKILYLIVQTFTLFKFITN